MGSLRRVRSLYIGTTNKLQRRLQEKKVSPVVKLFHDDLWLTSLQETRVDTENILFHLLLLCSKNTSRTDHSTMINRVTVLALNFFFYAQELPFTVARSVCKPMRVIRIYCLIGLLPLQQGFDQSISFSLAAITSLCALLSSDTSARKWSFDLLLGPQLFFILNWVLGRERI